MGIAFTIDPWDQVSISLVHADLYPCRPEWSIPPVTQGRNGLFYIVKGRGWVEMEGARLDAEPGDLFFSRVGVRFAAGHDPKRPVTVLSTGFLLKGPGGGDPLRRFELPRRLRIPEDRRREFTQLFTALTAEFNNQGANHALAARGLAMQLLACALGLAQSLPASCCEGKLPALPGEATRVAQVLEQIDRRLAEALDLETLAAWAHLSPTHFAAQFKLHTGQAPMAYLRRRRMERAASLLAGGDDSVEQIARAVGFGDPFHFSRVFRKLYGQAPSAYRTAARNPFRP